MVELLLLKGANKDALDDKGRTPLCVAAVNGHVAAALALLASGADVSLRRGYSDKGTILHAAARDGQIDIMRAAIERGADVDAADSYPETPLHRAARHAKVEAIDLLAEAGANIEARSDYGCTPLYNAAGQSTLKAVLALLKHGADVNAQTYNRETPLFFAASAAGRHGIAEVFDYLLRSGADETILTDNGTAIADVIGCCPVSQQDQPEDVDRVRKLCANAPVDRAWRRRGYVVMCRAHLGRIQQIQDINNAPAAGVARWARAKLTKTEKGSCGGAVETSPVDGRRGGDWAVVVARVLGFQEEGIFRSIVGYL